MRKIFVLLSLLIATSSLAQTALPPGLQSVLKLRDVPPGNISIDVRDLDSGETLLSLNADIPRNPASTIKLVTTLAALDLLGPAYRWKTDIYALGEISNGILKGDLLIKGYGDPFLVTERVWRMLRFVRQYGINEIEGDLLLDDSYFDVPDEDPGAFDKQPLRAYNVLPNALMMNFKVVRYLFEPDFDRQAVHVQVDPPLTNLEILNRLSLRRGHCAGYQRGIAITANEAVDRMTLDGRFPSGCKRYSMARTALDHDEFAYGLFMSLWRESGGTFDGGFRRAVAPEDAEPVVSFDSYPLSRLISSINKHSNNVMARQLLYTLAAELEGPPGTEAAGKRVIRQWLAGRGLSDPAFHIDNGAGLSRDARMTAEHFGRILGWAWRQPFMPEFLASMSLSGLDGTGKKRLDDDLIRGFAHIKTGSLDDVSAIAGYMQSRSGRRFSVVVLQNHKDIQRGPGDEAHIALLKYLSEQ